MKSFLRITIIISSLVGSVFLFNLSDVFAVPVISNVTIHNVTTNTATIDWDTDVPADSRVLYTENQSVVINDLVTSHSVTLENLTPGSLYALCIESEDTPGSRTESCGHSFTTDPEVLSDVTRPVISGISISDITESQAMITWVTDEIANGKIEYGTTTSYGSYPLPEEELTLEHSILLEGLSSNTMYHLRIFSTDGSGNQSKSNDVQFQTLSGGDSGESPTISGVAPVEIAEASIRISWITNEPADSQLAYGTTSAYGKTTMHDEALTVEHEQVITDLLPGTTYHIRILSRDIDGNLTASPDYVFTTLGGGESSSGGGGGIVDRVAPKISRVQVVPGISTALVSWETNEGAKVRVDYGPTSTYIDSTGTSTNLNRSHKVTIENLIQNSEYHFRVVAEDEVGNTSFSLDRTFTTKVSSGDRKSPEYVHDLSVSDIEQLSLTLSWSAPADDSGILYYEIHHAEFPITESNFYDTDVVHGHLMRVDNIDQHGASRSYRVTDLEPGKLHYFAIKASDPFGNVSPISNVVSATGAPVASHIDSDTIADSTPPAMVHDVQAIGLDKSIVIFWENPLDTDFLRTRVVRNEGRYPNNPLDGEIIYDGDGTHISDAPLKNATTYYYALFPYDEVPNYAEPVRLSLAPYAERDHYHVLSVGTVDHTTLQSCVTTQLKRGDRGAEVEHLQEILAADPDVYPQGLVTGYFGPFTEAAVRRLQKKEGLPETGIADESVRSCLNEIPVRQFLIEDNIDDTLKALAHDLSFGMSSDRVRVLQQHLVGHGFLNQGAVDGKYGSATREAVIEFQKFFNITPDGIAGPITRSKMIEHVHSPGNI